jgi:hypothetical protein
MSINYFFLSVNSTAFFKKGILKAKTKEEEEEEEERFEAKLILKLPLSFTRTSVFITKFAQILPKFELRAGTRKTRALLCV